MQLLGPSGQPISTQTLPVPVEKASVSAINSTSWYSLVREPYAGAWQRNKELRAADVLTYSAVYACVTLIASDIGKLRIKLVEQDDNGIWTEFDSAAFSPVLRKPNRYQTRIKFIEQWITSKLIHGNAYILKVRDERRVVVAMYVLDPTRVRPYVAPDGSIYYQLGADNLTGIESGVTIPAGEIIHDVMVALYHPLCGVSPLTACGLAATQGLNIITNSSKFFAQGSNPGGVLTTAGHIPQETSDRLKKDWETKYGGENWGRVAILGDGLKFEAMHVNPIDAQLIEQLKWSAEQVCSAFHVPPFMIGIGPAPPYTNVEALNLQYYSQCLQTLIEALELCLDEGLGLTEVTGKTYGVELDLDGLLRMDTLARVKAVADSIVAGFLSPNEARKKFDYKPVKGGEAPFLQQQNWTLAQLAERTPPADAPAPVAAPAPEQDDEPEDEDDDKQDAAFAGMLLRGLLASPEMNLSPWRALK